MTYIAVIGSGTMAVGIAAGFIAEQYSVLILGRSKDKALQCLQKAVALAQTITTHAAICEQNPNSLLAEQMSGDLDSWVDWQDCIWVIETVAEDLALKQAIFQSLDQRVPLHIPIGSNSSGFPISKISFHGAQRVKYSPSGFLVTVIVNDFKESIIRAALYPRPDTPIDFSVE